jgi:hypothetical protein
MQVGRRDASMEPAKEGTARMVQVEGEKDDGTKVIVEIDELVT